MRCTIDTGIARVLFMTVGPVMVLVHGFVKKSDRTPKDDLNLAIRRAKEVHNG